MPGYPQSKKVRSLFMGGQPISVGKGEVILGNEPAPDGVYYIDTGYIKIYSIGDNGDEYIHIIYGPGELFPLIWAYLGVPEITVFYEALSASVLWRIAREWFTSFIQNNLELSYAMSMQLAQQFRIFSDRVDNLEYRKASDRIVYRLLYLAGRFGVQDGNSVLIDAPITHEVFASTINLSRESVSREMEKLYDENILERGNGSLRILDIEILAAKLSKPVGLYNGERIATDRSDSET